MKPRRRCQDCGVFIYSTSDRVKRCRTCQDMRDKVLVEAIRAKYKRVDIDHEIDEMFDGGPNEKVAREIAELPAYKGKE